MNLTTKQTRRESYLHVRQSVAGKRGLILQSMPASEGITARELAYKMWKSGDIPAPERNYVHPRLNEMAAAGLVSIIGKRKCSISQKNCAVYSVVSEK
ncbi:hypothetical protein [Paenibacillus sp. NPDC058071]|uniref:hypothetical protein n=1 Tax=Paenibacillus sp. NPDC058071 TaxID=3346326 RepID=UPI0036D861A4